MAEENEQAVEAASSGPISRGGSNFAKYSKVCEESGIELCRYRMRTMRLIPCLFNVGAMIGDMYANTYNFAVPGISYGINCLTFGYLLGRDPAEGSLMRNGMKKRVS